MPAKKVSLQLDVDKTVELSDFNVSGSNTVSMTITLVELNIPVPYFLDFIGYLEWTKVNPKGTWRDFVKPMLLSLYDSFALAKRMKDQMESEAV